mgnify:CR=1 FL=1
MRRADRSFILFICLIYVFAFSACKGENQSTERKSAEEGLTVALIDSTAHFKLYKEGTNYQLHIQNPFPASSKVEVIQLYTKEKPKQRADITHQIKVPIKRALISSTTHLGFLNGLQKAASVVGASQLNLYYDSLFQRNVRQGKIVSLGQQRFNQEQVLSLNADILFSFAVSAADYKQIERLREMGVKVVSIAEYMEGDPLSKAKWLLAFSAFFGSEAVEKAQQQIYSIKQDYQNLKELAQKAKYRPKVLLSLPWKGSWYVGAGDSFQAKFLADAAADYIWKDRAGKASIALDIEAVFEKGITADYWLNPGNVTSYQDLFEQDQRFENFKAVKQRQVFNIYKRVNAAGGNDYWESAVYQPQLVLADLIHLLHPTLLPEHELHYYQALKE